MRTLSLAVNELQVPACKDSLFLKHWHFSFTDDYECDRDFPSHIRGDINATNRNSRLSCCRKQLTGGCRGLLTIRSRAESRHVGIVRKEPVEIAHRLLIEFFHSLIFKCVSNRTRKALIG